jgi:hypothetical protein
MNCVGELFGFLLSDDMEHLALLWVKVIDHLSSHVVRESRSAWS